MSGTGTILEAMLHAGIDVALVASDRRCRGLEIAEHAGIPALLVDRVDYGGFSKSFDRDGYSEALTKVLQSNNIDLIAMAGFGTITSGIFHDAFPGRVLNTHPSLLPDFKGWHAAGGDGRALRVQAERGGVVGFPRLDLRQTVGDQCR